MGLGAQPSIPRRLLFHFSVAGCTDVSGIPFRPFGSFGPLPNVEASRHPVESDWFVISVHAALGGGRVTYVPILKAKAGEFEALQHATAEVRSRMRPVMELVPDPELVRDQLETFSDRAMDAIPGGSLLTVDCGALPQERVLKGDVGGPIARLSESLGLRDVGMCPVVRTTDSESVLREAANAAAWHQRGVCLRVSVETGQALPDGATVRNTLQLLRLEPEEIDLLIDAGPVRSGVSLDRLAEHVLRAMTILSQLPWRQECVAAGAFPVSLTGFPRGQATSVARQDMQLWRRVAELWRGNPPDFGDFGVTHPRMPKPSRGTPDPNMRYTTQHSWEVFVYPRLRAGNDDFFILSRDLVSSPYWPSTGARTSWGDARLYECANRQRSKAGAGTQWRAWATSHHLATVTTYLAA